MKIRNFFRYEAFILIGFVLAAGTLLKLLGFYDISSDWFWFIAGVGLVIEGAISLVKQEKFDGKFKVVSREEYELLLKNKKP
jgi:hypothetical protein